jgi:hypothetical protein
MHTTFRAEKKLYKTFEITKKLKNDCADAVQKYYVDTTYVK